MTVRECGLPIGPFERLIEANRVDQVVTRYETFTQLLDYCQLSAAPVGELVLGVFGVATPKRVALSDRVCAGLQVVEHLQDIAEDHRRGRVYMPREDLDRFGCSEQDLTAPVPSAQLRALIAFEAARAQSICSAAAGRLRARCRPRRGSRSRASPPGACARSTRLEQGAATRLAYIWQMLRTAAGR